MGSMMNLMSISPNAKKISDENALILIEKIQKYTGGKTTKNQNYYSLFIDLLSYGIVVHHGSMPLEARLLVEEFTRKGFCKICFATSTLEQGINMPFDIVFIDRLESSDPLGVKKSYRSCWTFICRSKF